MHAAVAAASMVPQSWLTVSGKHVWLANYGVPGWTQAQIMNGDAGFTELTGVQTYTTDDEVITDTWIDGAVSVQANNVTFRRCLITGATSTTGGNGQAAPSVVNCGNNNADPDRVTGLRLEDCIVDCEGQANGVSGANFTLKRTHVFGAVINVWLNRATAEDSIISDNAPDSGGGHEDGIDSDSAVNAVVRRTWVAMDDGTENVTGALNLGGSFGSPTDGCTVEDSFLAGYSGTDMNLDHGATNLTVVRTAFSNVSSSLITTNQSGVPSGATWQGNYCPETGASVTP